MYTGGLRYCLRGADENTNFREKFNNLSSEELIKIVNTIGPYRAYADNAIYLLAKRKDERIVPTLLKILKSKNEHKRYVAFDALGIIKDERAIKPLMEIIGKGEGDPNYMNALRTLSKMKYEGVLDCVLDLAKRKDAFKNGSVELLEAYEKPKFISLLEEMKNKIDGDDFAAKLYKYDINDAIAHLKSLQQSQSPQEVTK